MKIKKDDHKEKEQRKQKGHSFYIDLMNDYGFKRIFGRPEGMALLLDMLKTFLPDEFRRIRKIELLPTEQLTETSFLMPPSISVIRSRLLSVRIM